MGMDMHPGRDPHLMKTDLTLCLQGCALLQGGILIASALAPRALAWRASLAPLPPLLRQMFWVYGAFIVLCILAFIGITVWKAPELAAGSPLARAICGFVAAFWGLRFLVQIFVFDARPYLTHWIYRWGYHALTVVFVLLTAVYGWAALGNPTH